MEDGEDREESSIGEFQELPPKPKIRRKYKHLAFTERDYKMRNPIDEFKIIKEIEDEVLSFQKENVKTYVISAGILYGKGEAVFNSHIQKAWLQEPVRLPYVGDGNNLVPTIHVTDLARIVFKVFEKKPERRYIFAVDNNQKPTQKKLIQSISNGIGTGLVESQDIPDSFKQAHPKMTPIQLDLDWRKSLLLDLKVQPSSLFIVPAEPEQPSIPQEGEEEAEPKEPEEVIELDWHCKSGMPANISKVKQEFEKARNLKPVKVMISGPPCSGKSFFGKQLGEHYNIPHIHMEKLLSDLLSWDQEQEDNHIKILAEKEKKLKEAKEQMVREAEERKKQAANEAAKKKADAEKNGEEEEPAEQDEKPEGEQNKDAEVKEDEEAPVAAKPKETVTVHVDGESDDDFEFIDIKEKIKAFIKENGKEKRIPDNLINEAVRWRLNRNDCQNRGYVLDGYPKTIQQAEDVFIITPQRPVKTKKVNEDGEEVDEEPAEEAEEEDPNKYKPTLQKNIYPESVIFLRASQLFLKRRSKKFLQEKAEDKGKWHISIMPTKINKFNENNSMDLFR
jgi:adenylate kinase